MLLERVRHLAAQAPDHPAIRCQDGTWSRQQLWARASEIARGLAAAEVQPGSVVGILDGRQASWVAAMLGVWMHRCAWVPLPPDLPEARRRQMMLAARVAATVQAGRIETHEATAPSRPALAYVIFTSGSQGAPKGVRVSHEGIAGMLQAQIDAFGIRACSRTLWGLYPGFDASVSDVGVALWAGATLVIAPQEVMQMASSKLIPFCQAQGVTHADLPPVLLNLVDPKDAPPKLECVIIGGEACALDAARRWARQVRLINVYGPTEATVCTSLEQVHPERWSAPSIGHPLPGVSYELAPWEGETCRLWIGGDQVALGYLDEELTRERFQRRDGVRWYDTGDLVECLDDRLIFKGRLDRQVKVAGCLVSPEEIERHMTKHPHVVAARAELVQDRLECWVEARGELDAQALTAHARRALPAYMVPGRWHLGALGRTQAQKITAQPSPWRAVCEAILGGPLRHDVPLSEQGMTSLAAMEILALAATRGLAHAFELDDRVTLRALEAQKIEERDTDASIWRSRAEALLPTPSSRLTPRPMRRVLMTGATGWLGSRLARELLAQDHGLHLIALVRGGQGQARLARALGRWDRA